MNTTHNSISGPGELRGLLAVHWRRWLVTTLLIAALAAAYAAVTPKSWQASQTIIVRNEAVGNDADGAKFHGPEDLKSIQETIVELSKGRSVLRAALVEAGPPADDPHPSAWPSDSDVEDLQKTVKIAPPKGVEFGGSEVFYLEIRDKDRQRAMALNAAVCRQLRLQLQQIRDAKACSMIDELEKALQLASRDLQAATARLTAFETEVGSDLPELRSMLDSNSSDTSLRRTVSEIESELRQCRASEEADRQLLKLLKEALADPKSLLAAPNRLLDSQPALRRLKEGLVDAQLRTAALEGRMSPVHPAVVSARESETQVAERLHSELTAAVQGVQSELSVAAGRLDLLEKQRRQAAARLDRLAGLRAAYTNLLSEANNRSKLLERAEQGLGNARSINASAKAASLISLVDGPDTGTHPVSTAAWMIVLAGVFGGLLTGVGVVLLTAPAPVQTTPSAATADGAAAATYPSRSARCHSIDGASSRHLAEQDEYVTAPRIAPERSAKEASPAPEECRNFTVSASYGLTCSQALKVLSNRGKLGNSPL